jgi:superfamily II DNA or RNA helicase
MTQAQLFDSPRRSALDDLFTDLDVDDGLRWYQREAIEGVKRELQVNRSTLLVMATGTGKTRCFSQLIKEWDQGPVLVLAHREELIQQAKASLEAIVGDYVDVERAEDKSSFRSRYVVGSIDSVRQKKRLERMGHNRFSLIVPDEAHHSVSASYQKVLDWFAPAKVCGVTATPDRSDEAALGQVYDSVAYVYDIEQAIDDGFLVPLEGRHVDVQNVDLSHVKKSAGDLQAGELDDVMVQAVAGIVHEVLRLYPDRQGLAFFPGVKSAELAAQAFNEKIPGCASWVSGETPPELRAEIVRDFKAGRIRYLCNCQVFLEGFDAPATSLLIDGAPTLSRARYAQKVGRVTRSIVDFFPLRRREQSAERRALIAASTKPFGTILDFVANSGKHDLVTPEDLLGGSYSDEEVALAKKARKKGGGGDVKAELEKARAELKRLASAARQAKVTAKVREFDPFRAFGLSVSESKRYENGYGKPAPSWLKDALLRKGVEPTEVAKLGGRAAFQLHGELKRRSKENLCTLKQSKILMKYGVDPQAVTFSQATEAIDYVAKSGWKPDPSKLFSLLTRERIPGEEG